MGTTLRRLSLSLFLIIIFTLSLCLSTLHTEPFKQKKRSLIPLCHFYFSHFFLFFSFKLKRGFYYSQPCFSFKWINMSMAEETKTKLESAGDSSDVDNGNCSSSGSGCDTKKTCVDCGTSRTPLWRGGPAGPKSLCNACGIKSRKKRQAALGIRQEDNKMKNKSTNNLNLENRNVKIGKGEPGNIKNRIKTDAENYSSSNNKKNVKRVSRFLDLGFKVPAMKRSAVEKKRLWRKLGEEERAAVLLMTLSCG